MDTASTVQVPLPAGVTVAYFEQKQPATLFCIGLNEMTWDIFFP